MMNMVEYESKLGSQGSKADGMERDYLVRIVTVKVLAFTLLFVRLKITNQIFKQRVHHNETVMNQGL